MPKWFVIWDDETKQLGAASAFSRSWLKDLFSSPFWDNIPDKPFDTLGTEFTVETGELRIAGIDASKVVSGVLDVARIPSLPRTKISDLFSSPFWDNIPDKPFDSLGTEFAVSNGKLVIAGIDAGKITSGVLDVARIPDLDASKITSGVFDVARIPSLPRSKISDLFSAPFWDNIPDKPFTNVTEFIADTSANKPSAGVAGRIFYELDTHLIWYDDGSKWVKMATADWEDMVNKPFNTLGGEFKVTNGELQIASIARSKITDFFSAPFWDNIPDKPSTFPPEAHTHDISEISIPSLPDWTSEM